MRTRTSKVRPIIRTTLENLGTSRTIDFSKQCSLGTKYSIIHVGELIVIIRE